MSLPDNTESRGEQYLRAIATGSTSGLPPFPQSRMEEYLDYIAKNGGGGGSGGGVLKVGMDMETMALDKTYAEITAGYAVLCVEQGGMVQYAPLVGSADAAFTLLFLAGNQQMTFVAESADGYPAYQQGGGGGTPE